MMDFRKLNHSGSQRTISGFGPASSSLVDRVADGCRRIPQRVFQTYGRHRAARGFTIIEVTIVVFGFSLIAVGLIALVSQLLTASFKQTGESATIDQARSAVASAMNELRNATTGTNGAFALDTTQSQQVIFYSNVGFGPTAPKIRYFAESGKLYKGVIYPVNNVYNSSAEVTTLVLNNLVATSSPIFYYYDGTYDGTPATDHPLTQPVNVTQVKFVKISLPIYNKAGVLSNNIYTVTAGAALRNLKTNLGG